MTSAPPPRTISTRSMPSVSTSRNSMSVPRCQGTACDTSAHTSTYSPTASAAIRSYVSVAPKIKSQCHRFRSMINAKNVCYTSIYSGVLSAMIDGRSRRFSLWRNQLRASAARRAARRGRSQRQWRSPERVGVVTDWQRGRFDLDSR